MVSIMINDKAVRAISYGGESVRKPAAKPAKPAKYQPSELDKQLDKILAARDAREAAKMTAKAKAKADAKRLEKAGIPTSKIRLDSIYEEQRRGWLRGGKRGLLIPRSDEARLELWDKNRLEHQEVMRKLNQELTEQNQGRTSTKKS